MKLIILIIMLLTLACSKEPAIFIKGEFGENKYSLSELLERPDVESVVITGSPDYPGGSRTYKAVRVSTLFKEIKMPEDAMILFQAFDGFSAPISPTRLLNKSDKHSIAYIALEDPKDPWPIIKKKGKSAGPFYLVWVNPEKSKISSEEWPYWLVGLEIKKSLKSEYPKIFPMDPKVSKGFKLFLKNCFPCHTINKQGESKIGPDLNLPMNPTEYFKLSVLKKLIRNPQDVRHWPEGRMLGFDKDILSDHDIEDVISYLEHMSKNKR